MKEFDLQMAKEGHLVCTRNGNPARIICFDLKHPLGYTIVACIMNNDGTENIEAFTDEGERFNGTIYEKDLFMISKKKEGWINLYRNPNQETQPDIHIYTSKEKAERTKNKNYITTIKIEWEECICV